MKITGNDVGKFCLVKFDDVGLQEGLIVANHSESKEVRVLLGSGDMERVESLQIQKLGKRLNFNTATTGI